MRGIVHLLEWKTHFAQDLSSNRDRPILFVGKGTMFVTNGEIDDRESVMMACGWKLNRKEVT